MSAFNLNELKDALKDNAEKSGVSFAGRNLKLDTEEDAIEVIKAIEECPQLEFFNLEGNTLGPNAAEAVAQALQKNGSLLKRALWKDMFTSRSKAEIPVALEHLGTSLSTAGAQLTELELSDNAFGPIGIKGLADFLTSKTCYSLRELHLNNNGLGIFGGKILAKALLDCCQYSSRDGTQLALKVIEVGRNRLENEGAEALASVFKKLTTLEEVAMPQNGISHKGIIALTKGLSANPGLRVLNLNDNTVGPQGAQALADILPNFPALEHLNLGDCLLKTKGSLILAEALGIEGNHPSLMELNLSFNEIHTRGAVPIARAMADKNYLNNLLLDGNSFGTDGRAVLREYLTNFERIDSLGTLSEDESDDEDEDENENENENENEDEDEEIEEEEEDEEEYEDEHDHELVDVDDNEFVVVDIDEDVDEDVVADDDDDDVNEDHANDNNSAMTNLLEDKIEKKVTISDFLQSPTEQKLLLLQYNTAEPFVEYVKNLVKDDDDEKLLEFKFIEEFIRLIMNVSAFCGSRLLNVRLKAELLTDILYAELFAYVVKHKQITMLNNTLLVYLGLLKSEDKNDGKIDWNLEGCFKALEKINKKEYFLQQTKDTLKFFLEKPVTVNRAKVTDPFEDSKNALKLALNCIQTT
ncbi:PREDICTED: ran GTPase-activating protein 1 [Polistes dominula]|uniref:Ran GTPase-activating protein 1 n=1 Tax=Polistes dominula TaxID=743375 RepID=A0ABM1J779_POLDO|nr:PREDICTED: ran GTPase-activating protein 1 [Polistes dominula]